MKNLARIGLCVLTLGMAMLLIEDLLSAKHGPAKWVAMALAAVGIIVTLVSGVIETGR